MLEGESGAHAWEIQGARRSHCHEVVTPVLLALAIVSFMHRGEQQMAWAPGMGGKGSWSKDWGQANRATAPGGAAKGKEWGEAHKESSFFSGSNMCPLGIHSNTFFWLLSGYLYQSHDYPDTTMLGMEATSGGRNRKILTLSYYLFFYSLGLRESYTTLC